MKLTIWYSIQNAGDGSAYPRWLESEALCEVDQEWLYEGWGEPCYGSLVIESDTPMRVMEEVKTAAALIKEVVEELAEEHMREYKAQGKYPEWFARLEGRLAALKSLPTAP